MHSLYVHHLALKSYANLYVMEFLFHNQSMLLWYAMVGLLL
jgi:hypothetical protein